MITKWQHALGGAALFSFPVLLGIFSPRFDGYCRARIIQYPLHDRPALDALYWHFAGDFGTHVLLGLLFSLAASLFLWAAGKIDSGAPSWHLFCATLGVFFGRSFLGCF